MTYKYEEVKREIWESKPDKILYQRRTAKEIRTTISFRFWLLFGIAVTALIVSVILFICGLSNWCIVPLIIDFIALAISDWLGEKNYNALPRKAELNKQKERYEEYLINVKEILQGCNIENKDQIECLKAEAKEIIDKFEKRYNTVQAKIKDILIIIPLTALVELCWKSKADEDPMNISYFIILAIIFFLFFSIIRNAYVHHFSSIRKDYQVLQVLQELDYQILKKNRYVQD